MAVVSACLGNPAINARRWPRPVNPHRSSVGRPSRLPLIASRRRWPSLNQGFLPIRSLSTRISSPRYSMTSFWLRFIQPATQITNNANGFIPTKWQRPLQFTSFHCHRQNLQKGGKYIQIRRYGHYAYQFARRTGWKRVSHFAPPAITRSDCACAHPRGEL